MQYGHKNYDKTIEAMNKYCYNNEYLIEICYHRKIPRKINLPENNWVDKFSKQPLLMMDIIMNIIIHNNEIISKLNLVQLLDEINYEHFRYYYIKYLLNRKEVFLEKAINLHSEMHHYYHETAAMLYFNLALAYAAVEDYDNMLGACYKILDLNQNLEELWEILVRYFIFIKLYTKALDYSEKSVNINNISEDFLIRQKLYQKVILEFLV